ncbi:MAG: hypothetical protein ACRD4H_03825, partial [Candidatus Acidiferrales bacterium]
ETTRAFFIRAAAAARLSTLFRAWRAVDESRRTIVAVNALLTSGIANAFRGYTALEGLLVTVSGDTCMAA